MAAYKNWSDEVQASKRTAHTQTANDFDANGLSAELMANKGQGSLPGGGLQRCDALVSKGCHLGNAEAMLGMSWIYGNGRGVQEDDAEAMRWRKMSAEHGDPIAMSSIAYDYEQGKGVTQDYAEAMRWYRKAADREDARAMWSIGHLFELGQGVAQDYADALV